MKVILLRMIRFFTYILIIATSAIIIGLGGAMAYVKNVTKDLPDYEVLKKYEPAVMTRMHASDGSIMGEFASKKRLYLPIDSIPDLIKSAYISAEDKNFFEHFGIDPEGFLRAIIKNIQNIRSKQHPEGASTITQQVAKNFLLTSDTTLQRKIKEAILALRIEKAYSKNHILELYLNEIYLGHGAYGIAAAALIYFNKSVNELNIEEIAYLAALPKGPSNYDPFKETDRAIARRNWVIDRMIENGYISKKQGTEAKEKPLGVRFRDTSVYTFGADYFTEEVRRQLIARYGSDVLYNGGLSVRTTLNPKLQLIVRNVLHNGLVKFDQSSGWHGAYNHIQDIKNADWGNSLSKIEGFSDIPEWRLAVILDSNSHGLRIGLQPEKEETGFISKKRETGFISIKDMKWALRIKNSNAKPSSILKIGDVIFVEANHHEKNTYYLRQPPKIQGAIVVMEPVTGRVLALSGGFSYSQSEFNRATQAYRQPGSAFKPFVYAAALDNGYTPASVILDGPIEIDQGAQGIWRPKNYGETFSGPSTLRYGIEHSRNLMTVRLAYDLGMPIVAEYAEHFGIYDKLKPILSMSLGAGETTVLRLVTAYAVIANGGKSIQPSMIDRIQNRYGHTIYRHDQRKCIECSDYEVEPKLIDERDQVLDPMTAYQITSMMEGVIQSGTASHLRYLHRTIAGKTGTTNDSKDAWFIGFTPDMVIGVFLGYDAPQHLGNSGTGSGLAVPLFGEVIEKAMAGKPNLNFQLPQGMMQIPINRKTGMHAKPSEPNTIIEAFKPGTGPSDIYQVIGSTESFKEGVKVPLLSPQVNRALETGKGGLY
ncbi:MAG: penicillin-binding protein 1A [Candidatus Tokpelaia sp. JSC161]|jgi:penicillin-binding protein 1A|nr:MAG: penicillin-binding protein 1A [Candidatus Tokpelaia sp. JSC161]